MDERPRVTGDIATDTHWYGRTPNGRLYSMEVRPGTSDWNTVNACAGANDEYDIPEGVTGWALDVGAHIGAWAVPFAIDNPGVSVLCVEALPENVEVLKRNIARNELTGRVWVALGAAGDGSVVEIFYPADEQHRFIGNADHPGAPTASTGPRESLTLEALHVMAASLPGDTTASRFSYMKIDCEACEYPVFAGGADLVGTIVGEHHRGIEGIVRALIDTHDVSLMGGTEAFGQFRAVRRG